MVAGLPTVTTTTAMTIAAAVVVGGTGGYLLYAIRRRRGTSAEAEDVARFREAVTGLNQVALVVPENPDIDALAAAVGLQALASDWGVGSTVYAQGEVTAEDAAAFCNIFDATPEILDEGGEDLSEEDGVVVVGGGGPIPSFGTPPVVAVIRHRPAASDETHVLTRTDDGATSTTVTRLLEQVGVVPEQRVATALLYGIRAGTQEFRRVRSQSDYEAASYLHDYADHGRIEALRAPGMSGETFDVIGEAIAERERRESFAVTNAGAVPTVGALEEAADTLLRLDGVSSAAVLGLHDDAVVVATRAEDVRTNAKTILEEAVEDAETVGGNADAATARMSLGLFSQVDGDQQETLDELIDASTRAALFDAYESS
jgi:nanoRNase/pAp phosphatase (c-di-AMP/oligoRNAs hydrolase)